MKASLTEGNSSVLTCVVRLEGHLSSSAPSVDSFLCIHHIILSLWVNLFPLLTYSSHLFACSDCAHFMLSSNKRAFALHHVFFWSYNIYVWYKAGDCWRNFPSSHHSSSNIFLLCKLSEEACLLHTVALTLLRLVFASCILLIRKFTHVSFALVKNVDDFFWSEKCKCRSTGTEI